MHLAISEIGTLEVRKAGVKDTPRLYSIGGYKTTDQISSLHHFCGWSLGHCEVD